MTPINLRTVPVSCVAATTTNIASFSTPPGVIDGVVLSNNDTVLVKDQTSTLENGFYIVNDGGSWTKSAANFYDGALVSVVNGTLNGGSIYMMDISGSNSSFIKVGAFSGVYSGAPININVKNFGAVGDGVVDDTAAIQSALDALTSGDVLYFPDGDYPITYVQFPASVDDITILGSPNSRIMITGAGTGYDITNGFRLHTSDNVVIDGLSFIGDGSSAYQVGVATYSRTISNLTVRNCYFYQVAMSVAITYGPVKNVNIYENRIVGTTARAISLVSSSDLYDFCGISIRDNFFDSNDSFGIYFGARNPSYLSGCSIVGNHFVNHRINVGTSSITTNSQIYVVAAYGLLISDNVFDKYYEHVIWVAPSIGDVEYLTISNNIIRRPQNDSNAIFLYNSTYETNGVVITNNQYYSSGIASKFLYQLYGKNVVISNNVAYILNPSSATSVIQMSAAGDSGGTNTHTDNVVVSDNVLVVTGGTGSNGVYLMSNSATSTALYMIYGNRIIATSGYRLYCSSITNPNIYIWNQIDDNTTYSGVARGSAAVNAKLIRVAEGTNKTAGIATLVAGTVTVNTTAVTANSRIQLTTQVPGGTVGTPYVSARTAGTSFTITSTSGTDTSQVAYLIVEPT